MSSYILIPVTNPVKFVEEDKFSTESNTLQDRYNYAHTQRPGIIHKPYEQPWIQGDKINLQFWRKDIEDLYIEVVDCNGRILQQLKQNPYQISYTETDNGNNTQDVTVTYTPPAGLLNLTIAWQDGNGNLTDYPVGNASPQTITIQAAGQFRYRFTFAFAAKTDIFYSNLLVSTALILNSIAYDIHQYEIDSYIFQPGVYFFRLYYKKSGALTYERPQISEPQRIHSNAVFPPLTLPESILFAYYNTFNEYNTIYQTPYYSGFVQVFYCRVEGGITYEQPENNTVSYDDQKMDKTLLDAKPYDTYQFFIGTKYGVPPWMASKLNMIRSHDMVFVDGRQWSFIENWEKKPIEGYGRAYYSIIAALAQTNYYTAVGGVPEEVSGGSGLACDVPGNISFTEITTVGVHVDWNVTTANGLGFQWELYEAQSPGMPVKTGSTLYNYVDIGGLQTMTDYQFYVRSVCAAGAFSAWGIPPQDPNFTTL